MTTIVFFNNKGGVGKTSLTYHLAWMFADRGVRVLAADFDPQANLTSMFLEEDRLEELWPEGEHPLSILGTIRPILRGTGDIAVPHVEEVADNIGVVVGDLGLSLFEDKLSDAWPRCLDGDESAFRIISAFHRVLLQAAQTREAELVLLDIGPNLGAINRAVLTAAQYVVVPLVPDLFSLQGLRNLGPTLRRWRQEWQERLKKNPEPELQLPVHSMEMSGYVIQQHAIRLDRPVKSYSRWLSRIPLEYRIHVLEESAATTVGARAENDPHCLHLLKHYRSLMPMAMEARKPMFFLRPADGAIGAHAKAVQDCYLDFKAMAFKIAARCGIPVS
ncbi:ParA family protein [candidate division KSB1 bacterium]|nr:AAA family ATPase [bacterium]NUM68772.1 ParA family protein [candidate division KSB1 bacterium]